MGSLLTGKFLDCLILLIAEVMREEMCSARPLDHHNGEVQMTVQGKGIYLS